MAHRFELVKYPHGNVMLVAVGGYATESEKKIIYEAGWMDEPYPAPRISEEHLSEWMQTDRFVTPLGSGLFGMLTPIEAKKWRAVIEQAFLKADIPLTSRRGTVQELM